MNIKHPFSFSKKEKIKKKDDFNNVFKNGQFVKLKYYICRYLQNSLDNSRIGIVISKRIGNSVKRNYEKRILREFFRQNKNKFRKNYDLIFTVLQCNVNFERKKNDFEEILEIIQNNEN